ARSFGQKLIFAVGDTGDALSATVKIWTEEELLYAFSAGLSKSVTSTETLIEFANITARNIEIDARGAIGSVEAEIEIELGDGNQQKKLTDDERVALAAAERQDIIYIAGYETGTVDTSYANAVFANTGSGDGIRGTITIAGGIAPGAYKPGDLI